MSGTFGIVEEPHPLIFDQFRYYLARCVGHTVPNNEQFELLDRLGEGALYRVEEQPPVVMRRDQYGRLRWQMRNELEWAAADQRKDYKLKRGVFIYRSQVHPPQRSSNLYGILSVSKGSRYLSGFL